MGYASALDMLAIVERETAMTWHLQHNHYPPVPLAMVAPCLDAVDALNDDDVDREISLPDGVTYRDATTAPAWAIADAHHLDSFITE